MYLQIFFSNILTNIQGSPYSKNIETWGRSEGMTGDFQELHRDMFYKNVLVLHIIFFYELLCLMPLSTIFQLYCGSFIGGGNQSAQRKPLICVWQVTDKLYHIMLYTSPWLGFKPTTSVVIGTDCIGSCKSNYHMITADDGPKTDWSFPLTHTIIRIYL